MNNTRFIIMAMITAGLFSGCVNKQLEDVVLYCKTYEFGENIVHCGPTGCTYSTEPIVAEISEIGGITTIINLEKVDITASYIPSDDPTLAIKSFPIPAGEEVSRFAGLSAKGRLEIFRDKGIFIGKGDGADIKICFVKNK